MCNLVYAVCVESACTCIVDTEQKHAFLNFPLNALNSIRALFFHSSSRFTFPLT